MHQGSVDACTQRQCPPSSWWMCAINCIVDQSLNEIWEYVRFGTPAVVNGDLEEKAQAMKREGVKKKEKRKKKEKKGPQKPCLGPFQLPSTQGYPSIDDILYATPNRLSLTRTSSTWAVLRDDALKCLLPWPVVKGRFGPSRDSLSSLVRLFSGTGRWSLICGMRG